MYIRNCKDAFDYAIRILTIFQYDKVIFVFLTQGRPPTIQFGKSLVKAASLQRLLYLPSMTQPDTAQINCGQFYKINDTMF